MARKYYAGIINIIINMLSYILSRESLMISNNNIYFISFLMLGIATSITPSIVLIYGIGQFNIIRLVGEGSVTQEFSVALGIVSLAVVFLNPVGGYICDNTRLSFGKRRFWIITGSILGYLNMLWFAFSSNMFELAFSWVFVIFSYSLVLLSYQALIPEKINPKNFGKVSGLISSVSPLILMLICIIVMGLFSSIDLKYKIIFISSIQLISNLIIAWFIGDWIGEDYSYKTATKKTVLLTIYIQA